MSPRISFIVSLILEVRRSFVLEGWYKHIKTTTCMFMIWHVPFFLILGSSFFDFFISMSLQINILASLYVSRTNIRSIVQKVPSYSLFCVWYEMYCMATNLLDYVGILLLVYSTYKYVIYYYLL